MILPSICALAATENLTAKRINLCRAHSGQAEGLGWYRGVVPNRPTTSMPLTTEQLAARLKGARSTSKRKAEAVRLNGAKGGRPGNPEIKRIMAERGVSRQRAHQILNATAKGGRPRKQK